MKLNEPWNPLCRFLTKNRLVLICTVLLLTVSSIFTNSTYAQVTQVAVRGKVSDETGKPLQGVSITIKGTPGGTVSNEKGEYKISIPEKSSKLLSFSFVGMETKEVKFNNQAELNVSLVPFVEQQQEVVVVGYGTQKKQAITGAVVQADLKTYDKVPVNNIMETLKGTVAGLNVGEANTAGGVPGFTIRGTNTIAASTSPLVVLDGVIFSGSMADISPNDIESVTILKDASAAAVYGSRAANGVMLIESKKGVSVKGKPKFDIRTSQGFTNELKPLEVYDANGYMQHLYDFLIDNGTALTFDQTPNFLQTNEKVNYNKTPDHAPTLVDPYSLFRQQGHNFNASVSVSERTEKMSYFLSGSMVDQEGVIQHDAFKHYTLRANLESKVTSWLTLGLKAFYSNRNYPDARIYGSAGNGNGSGTSNGSSPYLFSPYADIYNTDGSYNMYPQTTTSFVNPFSMMANEAYNRASNLNGILSANVKIPWVKGLTYTLNYSQTQNTSEVGTFYGVNSYTGLATKGSGSRSYSRGTAVLVDNILKYNRTFAHDHNIDVTLLYSSQKNSAYGEGLSATGFDNDQLGTYRLQAGAIQAVSTSGSSNESVGQMARATYSFKNKYSLTGTYRMDGYSAFSANHKYGSFGSIGANWNITEENFMKNQSVFSYLAMRASYGTNGNQSIAPYSTLAKITNGYYYFQGDANYTYTQSIGTLGNDDLLWESTTGLNFGLDFKILKGRISGSIDGYFTRTNNLAFTLNLPTASGFSTITANAGEIQNRGLEINLNSINMQKGKFVWSSALAFSMNRNKVTHLLGDANGDGVEDDIVSSNLFIGRSLTEVYNYKVTGMWQQSDKDNGSIMTGYLPGQYKIQDVNGDGKITSDQDRQFLGNTNANFRASLTNTFTYGDFSVLIYLNSIWGGNNYFINGGNTPWNDGYTNRGDMNHPVYDYWTPNNTGAEFPRLSYGTKALVRAPKYYDRSFIRLQKVAISYELTRHVKKYGIEGMYLSLAGDNLGTYAPNWIGLDAATGSGLTATSIPSLRTVAINLNINF